MSAKKVAERKTFRKTNSSRIVVVAEPPPVEGAKSRASALLEKKRHVMAAKAGHESAKHEKEKHEKKERRAEKKHAAKKVRHEKKHVMHGINKRKEGAAHPSQHQVHHTHPAHPSHHEAHESNHHAQHIIHSRSHGIAKHLARIVRRPGKHDAARHDINSSPPTAVRYHKISSPPHAVARHHAKHHHTDSSPSHKRARHDTNSSRSPMSVRHHKEEIGKDYAFDEHISRAAEPAEQIPKRKRFDLSRFHPKKVHSHLRGLLYRRFVEKKGAEDRRSRAGQMLSAKRQESGDYPRFFIIPSKKLVSIPAGAKSMIYPLIKPYSYANIHHDEREGALMYRVVEPKLSEEERFVLDKLKEGMIQIIDVSMSTVKDEKNMVDFLEDRVRYLLEEYGFELAEDQYLKIMYYIYRDFVGMNEIEPLLRDLYIEDISCDGVGVPLYVVHQKLGSLKTSVAFNDEKELREMVIKMAERCDRYISYAEPLLDGSLPDGTRIQASLAGDVTTRGPTFSIRKFPERPFSAVDMIRLGTASAEMLAYLWFAVENGANILIAGGTSTGKTSLLNSISLFIAPEAKIVSIEDTRELNLLHENWVPGVSRTGFAGTKTGEVSMFDLLKESFRQNPDYLIVGEVRGEETSVMFQGMASGHACISTMHAGGVDDVLKRLQTRPISLPPSLVETLDIIIFMTHAREKGKSARRVKEIIEIERVDPESGKAQTNKVFGWDPASDKYEYTRAVHLLSQISLEKGIPLEKIMEEIGTRRDVLEWLANYDLKDWKEVAKYIVMYYRDREKVLRTMGKRRRRPFGVTEVEPEFIEGADSEK